MSDYLQTSTLERSATGHTDAEVPPYGDLTGTVTTLGTWTSATTSDDALCPAQNGQVTFHVSDSSWMVVNDWIILVGFGTFRVESKPDVTHVIATYLPNSAQTPNTTPLNTLIPSGTRVMVGSFSDTADSSAGLYYRWTDKSHDYLTSGGTSGVKADYNVVKTVGSVPGQVLWANHYGGTGYDKFVCIETRADGSLLAGGWFFSPSANFGQGSMANLGASTGVIAKYDSSGNCAWVKRFGASGGYTTVNAIQVDPHANNGDFVACGTFVIRTTIGTTTFEDLSTQVNHWCAKLNANGDVLWAAHSARVVQASQTAGVGTPTLAVSPLDGRILIVGAVNGLTAWGGTDGMSSLSSNFNSTALLQLNADGTSVSLRKFDNNNWFTQPVIDTAGRVYLALYFNGSIDVGNGPIAASGLGTTDILLARLEPDLSFGGQSWNRSFGGTRSDSPTNIALTPDGSGLICLGSFAEDKINFGGPDLLGGNAGKLFLVRLAANDGSWTSQSWGRSFTTSPYDASEQFPIALAIKKSTGETVIGGRFNGSFNAGDQTLSGSGIFVIRFRADGTTVWSQRLGSSSDTLAALGYNDFGIFAVGDTPGSTFGAYTLTSYGSNDAFLVKLSA